MNKFMLNETSYHGAGAISELPTEVKSRGLKKALICCGPTLLRHGVIARVTDVMDAAGLRYEIYSDIKPNPTIENVTDGVAAFKAAGADYLIAIGGGSPMDTSKAIGIIINNPEFADVRSLEGVADTKKPCVPIIAIPTTAGTAAEVTINYVITDVEKKRKFVCVDPHDMPIVAIVDPEMMSSMPAGLTASTGMDALTHAIESYINVNASPMTKMYSLEAIRLISKSLIPAVLDGRNEQAREDMLLAALYAGIAICSAPTALVHSMSRPLGAWFHIPHGLANAMLLSSVMEYNRPSCPEKFRDIAIAMGENVEGLSVREASIAAVDAIAAIADETGLPKLLSSQGVTEDKIPTLAKDAFAAGSTANNPRVPTVEEIETIYKSVF